jgi:hypothetical protein
MVAVVQLAITSGAVLRGALFDTGEACTRMSGKSLCAILLCHARASLRERREIAAPNDEFSKRFQLHRPPSPSRENISISFLQKL